MLLVINILLEQPVSNDGFVLAGRLDKMALAINASSTSSVPLVTGFYHSYFVFIDNRDNYHKLSKN